ncbi:MAG: hypothetical protein ACLGI9_02100 [Thermoanaerobaculia bacterium]
MIREQPRPELPNTRSAWAGLVREHSGLLLTAGYLALTLVGLIYEFWFFWYFRINILEYVETSDFLLAALRTPLVIVLSALPLLLAWLLLRSNEWLRRRFPRYGSWDRGLDSRIFKTVEARRTFWGFFVLIYAALFTQIYAERVSSRIKAGHGREVRVDLTSGARFSSRTLLLGTTSKFVFLYLPAEKRTHVIPIENLSQLVVSAEKRPTG